MIHLPEGFDSIFRYIVVVSQRAEQLVNGAKARSESRHDKATLVAIDDVDEGLVEWRVLTQEELDAQRQAIVDQLRAEVGVTDGELPTSAPIPDVLPTAAGARRPVGAAEAGERDDELLRLQKLLGMAGAMDEESLGDDDEDEDEDVEAPEEEPETIDLDEAADELEGDDDDEDED